MGDYRATIRTVREGATDPGGFVVEHHRTPRAAIDVDLWSGGHLLAGRRPGPAGGMRR